MLLGLVGTALADDQPAPPKLPRIDVRIGKTAERNVGYIRGGWFCDDADLITGELVTRGEPPNDANYFVVTGKKVGETHCLVGDVQHFHIVYDVVVTR